METSELPAKSLLKTKHNLNREKRKEPRDQWDQKKRRQGGMWHKLYSDLKSGKGINTKKEDRKMLNVKDHQKCPDC